MYSNMTFEGYIEKIGFIKEAGEYVIDLGLSKKMKKILKWLQKGIEKVKHLGETEIKNNQMAEGILSGEVNVEDVI